MSVQTRRHKRKERRLPRHRTLYRQTPFQVDLDHEGSLWEPLLTRHRQTPSNSPISTSQVTETISPFPPTPRISPTVAHNNPTVIFVTGYSSPDVDGVI